MKEREIVPKQLLNCPALYSLYELVAAQKVPFVSKYWHAMFWGVSKDVCESNLHN